MTVSDETRVPAAGTTDKVKVTIAALLVLAGVAGYYVLGSQGQATWIRWVAVAAGLVLAGIVVAFSRYGSELNQFIADSRIELRKIVWPTRQETLTTTAVVIAFLFVAGLFFWGLDVVLAWATRSLTQGG